MERRTNDVAFFPCPICGRKPYVIYYPPNYGVAFCNGTFFYPHDQIVASVLYEDSSSLVKRLASDWNQGQFLEFGEKEDER